MPRRFFNRKPISQGPCKQKTKWKFLLMVMVLLALFIRDAELHGLHRNHSRKVHLDPWKSSYYFENGPRHHHSKKVEEGPATTAVGFRRRKPRVGNTHFPWMHNDPHRRQIIKGTFQPEFSEKLANLTITRGRDARFKCVVDHLGGYKVGWVKVDDKAIQAIHDHVITQNPRVSASHSDQSTWYLLIKKVQESDRGTYMCQVNTDPVIHELAYLEVLHPPDFQMVETSSSMEVQEGSPLKLKCKAYGRPKPRITWRRENNTEIYIRGPDGNRVKVESFSGEILDLPRMMRSDMGNYLCIASNGVPPSVRKTIRVTVRFHPMMQVPNQLVGAPLGTDVTLVCFAEAYPRSINYWVKDRKVWLNPDTDQDLTFIYKIGEVVHFTKKYEVDLKVLSDYELNMTLKIRNLTPKDMGSYNCVCKNPVGEVVSQIRVYEITDERLSNQQNKGSRGGSVTKKPGRQVKLVRPGKAGNAITDDNAKKYPHEQGRPNGAAGQQNFPYVYFSYFFISYLIV